MGDEIEHSIKATRKWISSEKKDLWRADGEVGMKLEAT